MRRIISIVIDSLPLSSIIMCLFCYCVLCLHVESLADGLEWLWSSEALFILFSIINSKSLTVVACRVFPRDSAYRRHAGLHTAGREEPGAPAELPPGLPQVSAAPEWRW